MLILYFLRTSDSSTEHGAIYNNRLLLPFAPPILLLLSFPTSEALIDYEEEQHDPVSLLSMKADSMVFNTIITTILGAVFFAYEGYNNGGGSYEGGRFHPGNE